MAGIGCGANLPPWAAKTALKCGQDAFELRYAGSYSAQVQLGIGWVRTVWKVFGVEGA
jgi:hypothetical protein